MSNEKVLERRLRNEVKKLGGLAVKFWVVNFAGFPDRVVLMPGGRIWFVETKSTGKTPTKIQQKVISILRDLGFSVWVVDSENMLSLFLNKVKDAE